LRSAPEIRVIWNALPEGDYGDILRLLLLTGCRRDEIGLLKWSYIDRDVQWITLPPGIDGPKNWRSHRVPLVGPARAILIKRQTLRIAGRDFVFGTKMNGKGFSNWSRNKDYLDEAIAKVATIPHWTPHAFRHTCETGLLEMKVPPYIVDRVLNHTEKNSTRARAAATYDHAQLDDDKREALTKWVERVMAIVEDSAKQKAA
jgi:integrase